MNIRKMSTLMILGIFLFVTLFTTDLSDYRIVHAASLNKTSVSLKEGKAFQLKISGTTEKIKWTTSDKSVVTVTPSGVIKAKSGGNAIVKGRVKGKTYRCKVNVKCKKHDWNSGSITKEATCETKGIIQYTCEACGATKDATIEKIEHIYEKTVTVNATKEQTGYVEYKCTRCGDKKTDGTIYYQPSESQAYSDIMAMQSSYPEGMSWTNDDYYGWEAGIYSGGYGCMGFAFALSDAAFGKLTPAISHSDLNNLKVGDIIRINGDTHSVIVIKVNGDTITIAEGNYNNSVHWGRTLSKASLESDSSLYIITRYQD